MLLSYSTGSYVDDTFYSKTEADTLLADKSTNIGDIELPGWLDIGTSGYTNSRIRCNAVVGGHTGYAELKANGSWDMFINLQTTYPNSGWMYFKINNDSYIQLSASDNKVTLYTDTLIEGRLDVGKHPSYSTNWINLHTDNETGNGFTGAMSFTAYGGKQCLWNITSKTSDVKMEIKLDNTLFMKFFNNNTNIQHYKPLVNSSDDRLTENEQLIEHACETLSKLRPQLYDNKHTHNTVIANDDPSTWYKESGLIAQELYYDAP